MKRTVLLSVLIKKNMPACARTSAWTHMVPHYIGRNTTILVLKVQFCLCLGELVNLQRESRWVEKGLWVCLFVLYAVWESSGCDYVPLDCFPVSSSNWSAWMFVVLNVLFFPEESRQCSLTDSHSLFIFLTLAVRSPRGPWTKRDKAVDLHESISASWLILFHCTYHTNHTE